MANIKQQKKRVRTDEVARLRNVAWRSRVKTFVKQADEAISGGNADEAAKAVQKAIAEIDRAQSKGVFHAKSAARKKSSLQRRIAKV